MTQVHEILRHFKVYRYLLSAGSGTMVTIACVKLFPKKAGSKDDRVTKKDSLSSKKLSSTTGIE